MHNALGADHPPAVQKPHIPQISPASIPAQGKRRGRRLEPVPAERQPFLPKENACHIHSTQDSSPCYLEQQTASPSCELTSDLQQHPPSEYQLTPLLSSTTVKFHPPNEMRELSKPRRGRLDNEKFAQKPRRGRLEKEKKVNLEKYEKLCGRWVSCLFMMQCVFCANMGFCKL